MQQMVTMDHYGSTLAEAKRFRSWFLRYNYAVPIEAEIAEAMANAGRREAEFADG